MKINQISIYKGIKITVNGTKNLVLRNTGESLKPRWLVFMTTDRCNSRCEHCNIWQQEPTENPLTAEEIGKTLSAPLFRGVEYILNTGGEAALRNDLEEIILTQHRVLPKARIQLSTNGLLPERVINTVKSALEHDVCVDLGTSIDGIGEDHDRIRGVKGNFDKVDYLLHQLIPLREKHGNRLFIGAQITLSEHNLDSLEKVRAYTREMNISLLEGWYNESPFYANIGKNSASKEMIKAVESQPSSPLQERWMRLLKGKSIKFPCFAMYTFCVLKCNGDIVPCLNLWDNKAGNIRESSPQRIWQSPEARKVRGVVKDCQGCLNVWGAGWSFHSCPFPLLPFFIKHPRNLTKSLRSIE